MVDSTGLPPDLDIKEDEEFSKARLDRAFGWIAAKIRGLESFSPSWAKEVETLRAFGLARINEAILPAYRRVVELGRFGFLKADSNTDLSLEPDATRVFIIGDENQRALFTPTEFVAVTRISASDEWAIGRVLSYDAKTGSLRVVILSASVSPGAHGDWQITASAATLVAASQMLAEARTARDDASALKTDTASISNAAVQDIGAIRDAAIAAQQAAEKAVGDANAAALLIAGGPVTSVNGQNGPVEVTATNLPGLDASLGQRLSIAARQTLTAAQRLFGLENLGIFDGMLVPTGVVTHFYGRTAPKGWLKLNGALLLRSDFPELYTFAQSSGGIVSEAEWQAGARGCFSTGDGATTFRLPDARGEFFRVWSDGAGVDAGRTFASQQGEDFKSHGHSGVVHGVGDHVHSAWTDSKGAHFHYYLHSSWNDIVHTVQGGISSIKTGQNNFNERYNTDGAGNHSHNVGIGGAGAHSHELTIATSGGAETRPRNIALLAIIKY